MSVVDAAINVTLLKVHYFCCDFLVVTLIVNNNIGMMFLAEVFVPSMLNMGIGFHNRVKGMFLSLVYF